MGMIADFVNNVCEEKTLLCNPFPIDFKHATKSIPGFMDNSATKPHGSKEQSVLHVISMLRSIYDHQTKDQELHIVMPSPAAVVTPKAFPATPIGDKLCDRVVNFLDCWTPPATLPDTSDNYHNQVLGNLRYL